MQRVGFKCNVAKFLSSKRTVNEVVSLRLLLLISQVNPFQLQKSRKEADDLRRLLDETRSGLDEALSKNSGLEKVSAFSQIVNVSMHRRRSI